MINKKSYYYFDEAGEPQILGHRGVNLVAKGTASKVFKTAGFFILLYCSPQK